MGFKKFGIRRDYWAATGDREVDRGRYNVTNDSADTYVFKVPGLRNVAMSPPYFHDGSVATLSQAIRVMADLQTGKKLSDQQIDSIVQFLQALTGKLPLNYAPPPAFKEDDGGLLRLAMKSTPLNCAPLSQSGRDGHPRDIVKVNQVDNAVSLILDALQFPGFQTTPESQQAVDNLVEATRLELSSVWWEGSSGRFKAGWKEKSGRRIDVMEAGAWILKSL